MNSKIRNALLIIMNDRSFELSEQNVRVYVYCSQEYDVLSIFSYTVVVYQFCSCTEWHITYATLYICDMPLCTSGVSRLFCPKNQIIWELKIAQYKMYTKILAQGTKFGSGTTGLDNPVYGRNIANQISPALYRQAKYRQSIISPVNNIASNISPGKISPVNNIASK